MATYQFIIELIPEIWIENKKNPVELLFDQDSYDSSVAWKNITLKYELESLLSIILPRGKSWHKDLYVWGNEENSDIQVWLRDGNINSIMIRLDLRNDIENLKLQIVDLAKRLNCELFFPHSRQIVDPDITLLNKAILNSNAEKFVNDPERFLDELEKNKHQND